MGADLYFASQEFEREKGAKVIKAARELVALSPDLKTLLEDLNASGLGRARCFTQALDRLEDEVNKEF